MFGNHPLPNIAPSLFASHHHQPRSPRCRRGRCPSQMPARAKRGALIVERHARASPPPRHHRRLVRTRRHVITADSRRPAVTTANEPETPCHSRRRAPTAANIPYTTRHSRPCHATVPDNPRRHVTAADWLQPPCQCR